MPRIALIMGSKSDLPKIQPAINILKDFNINSDLRIMSAHRTPEVLQAYIKNAPSKGIQIFIAVAGLAAHLAGVIASHTILPVIGIPVQAGALNGIDALLATVQMPGGIPVATVGIGSCGPKNAALLAIQMLALSDKTLAKKLLEFRQIQTNSVLESDAAIQL